MDEKKSKNQEVSIDEEDKYEFMDLLKAIVEEKEEDE